MPYPINIHSLDTRFQAVADVFASLFESGAELGAGVSVWQNGQCLVNLTGGYMDRGKTKRWQEDTIVPVYSSTKPIAALVLAIILDGLDGKVSYDTPVAEIWPEFASHGKDRITLGELVSHQAGLPGFIEEVSPDIWLDPPACAAALGALKPLWSPGTAHGYHPTSWGYLIGEVIKRLSESSCGEMLSFKLTNTREPNAAREIDFRIGTEDSAAPRIAEMERPRALPQLGEINAATEAAFLKPWSSPGRNRDLWRRIEIPSANGHGTAAALAELMQIYARGGLHGQSRVLSETGFSALVQTRCLGPDLVLPFITEFAAGVMRNNLGLYGPNPETLCHSGWGGSMVVADPELKLSFAYVMNRQSNALQADPRAVALLDALYTCV